MENLKTNKVMLFNGACVSTKDIMPGDILMAPDGKGKIVSETRHEYGEIYRISAAGIKDYYVNSNNELELVCDSIDGITLMDGRFIKNHEIIHLPVIEYLKEQSHIKKSLKLRKAKADFMAKKDNKINDPYAEGYSLMNKELKYIPNLYLRNEKMIRKQYLAGLIDSHGVVDENEICIHISMPSKEIKKMLIKDIIFLCQSLGLKAFYRKEKIHISGILSDIPFKKDHDITDTQDSDLLSIYINSVGKEDFYSFDLLDEDKRYLLYDFTVSLAECF